MNDRHDCSDHTHDGDTVNRWTSQAEGRNDPEELDHMKTVTESFRQYATFARTERFGHAQRVLACPEEQKHYLPPSLQPGTEEYQQKEEEFRDAEVRNQFFLDCVLRHAELSTSQETLQKDTGKERSWASDHHMDKVKSIFKSLVRDWSEEGALERAVAYDPIINGFMKHLPCQSDDGSSSPPPPPPPPPPRVVVPGAGLGRLALELCSKGYAVQGNEFSLQMLLPSDFILNGGCSPDQSFSIYPYLTETTNVRSYKDLVKPVLVPDIDPVRMLIGDGSDNKGEDQVSSRMPDFSMAAGDFISIYNCEQERGKWDGVASCFFLDTASIVVEYLQTIHSMLKDGGLLINFGPLLWHFSTTPMRPGETQESYSHRLSSLDPRYLESIDLTYEDVKHVLDRVGFDIIEESNHIAYYTANPHSLKKNEYTCVYFVAKKRQGSNQQR